MLVRRLFSTAAEFFDHSGSADRRVAGSRIRSADMGLVWLTARAIVASSYPSGDFLTTRGEELDSAGGEVRYALTSCDSVVAPEDFVADRQEIHDGCLKTLLVLLRL
jgi:hypothetical protein